MIIRRGTFYADWILTADGIVRSSVIGFAHVRRGRCRAFGFLLPRRCFVKILRLFIGCCAVVTGPAGRRPEAVSGCISDCALFIGGCRGCGRGFFKIRV